MPRLRFPDLPPGPLYELKLMLHDLHGKAGAPSTRAMAEAVGCSHDKIYKLFTSDEFPADGATLFRVAGWLASQGPRPRFTEDDDERESEFYDLLDRRWEAAQRYASYLPLPASQATRVRRGRQRRPRTGSPAAEDPSDDTDAGQLPPRSPAHPAKNRSTLHGTPGTKTAVVETGAFPDPTQSRALIVAASHFDSPDLPDIPSARAGARRLADILTDPQREGHVPDTQVLLNPESPRQVLEAIDHASQAKDTFILHFAGHGLVTRQGTLTLAMQTTDPAFRFSSLAWEDARSLIAESSAARSLVVMDACFAGKALAGTMGTANGAFYLPVSELLTSTGAYELAFAGTDSPAFTGALINLLTNGDPNLPEILTTDDIYRGLHNWARREDKPLPQRFRRGNGVLALARNPAHRSLGISTRRPLLGGHETLEP
jgi:CHAT domain